MVVKWFREMYPQFGMSLFAVNNENTYALNPENTIGAIVKDQMDKKKGKLSGVSDLICLVPKKDFPWHRGIWICELKIGAKYHDHQKQFIEEQTWNGHNAKMIRGKDVKDLAEKVIADLKLHMQGYPDFYEQLKNNTESLDI